MIANKLNMKILIISDIHGSLSDIRKIILLEEKENFDQIIILGDILHKGMYEDSTESTQVSMLLNLLSDKIIAVRGNCDDEYDLKLLDFELPRKRELLIDGYYWHLMHGNKVELDKKEGIIYLMGHTHIPCISKNTINPGSISQPRGNSKNSYIIYHDKTFSLYNLNTNELTQKITLED